MSKLTEAERNRIVDAAMVAITAAQESIRAVTHEPNMHNRFAAHETANEAFAAFVAAVDDVTDLVEVSS